MTGYYLYFLAMGIVIGFGIGWVACARRHISRMKALHRTLSEIIDPRELDQLFSKGKVVVRKTGRYTSH